MKKIWTPIVIILLALMLAVPVSAKECDKGMSVEWADVNYTQLDMRAMEYLWGTWMVQYGGTVAVLPFDDLSQQSLLENPYGSGGSGLAERLSYSLGDQFSKLGLLPLPYGDCYYALNDVIGGHDEDETISNSDENNAYHLANKSEFTLSTIKEFAPGAYPTKRMEDTPVHLSKDEITKIGDTLGADLIVRGSISTYGLQDKFEANLRTFIPPFLGLLNKEKEGMIYINAYMYDAHSGELVWAVSEMVENAADFPFFTTDYEVLTGIETEVAKRIVSHLVPPMMGECGEGGWEHGGMMHGGPMMGMMGGMMGGMMHGGCNMGMMGAGGSMEGMGSCGMMGDDDEDDDEYGDIDDSDGCDMEGMEGMEGMHEGADHQCGESCKMMGDDQKSGEGCEMMSGDQKCGKEGKHEGDEQKCGKDKKHKGNKCRHHKKHRADADEEPGPRNKDA